MSTAPHLRLVTSDGDPVEDQSLSPPPTKAGERLFPVFNRRGGSAFTSVIAVSLVIHGAIIAASIDWTTFTEERGAGSSQETIVIEGIDVILLDQMPSVRPPLATAKIVTEADVAQPPPDKQVAAIAPQAVVETAADVAASPDANVQAINTADRGTTAISPESPVELAPVEAAVAGPIADLQIAAIETHTVVETSAEATTSHDRSVQAPDAGGRTAAVVKAKSPVEAANLDESEPVSETATAANEAAPATTAVPTDRRRPIGSAELALAAAADTPAAPADAPAIAIDQSQTRRSADIAGTDIVPAGEPTPSVSADTVRPDRSGEVAQVVAADKPVAIAGAMVATVKNDAPTGSIEDGAVTAEVVPPPPIPRRRPVIASAATSSPTRQPPAVKTRHAPNPPAEASAGNGGRKSAAAGTANLASYRSKLVAHLRRHRTYPEAARRRRMAGTATVSFTINRAGRVVAVSLARRTGHAVLDRAALAMVRRASPFPAIPASIGRLQVTIRAPIRFAAR